MNKKILRLAVPNIISNLTVPLLSSVDTALVGHLEHAYYIGAIAIGGMIFNFIYWGFGFLRMGTTGLTAQAFGEQNETESVRTLYRSLAVAAISGLLLIILQYPLSAFAFRFVDSSPEVITHARTYFHIRIFTAPATLMMYAFTGWFLGMQNARYPLFLTVLVNILNLLLNLYFLQVLSMNVDGVAFGTLISGYAGLFFSLYLLKRKYHNYLRPVRIAEILDLAPLKKFMIVNRDIFIRTLVLISAFAFFTVRSAAGGELILAANAILINLWTVMSYGIDGFAFAAESLVGLSIGARDRNGLKRSIRASFYWGVGLGLLYSVVYGLFSSQILALFTDKTEILQLAVRFMPWTVAAPLLSSFCYIWDGIYIGATASVAMRNAMLISFFGFYLPLYFILEGVLGNHGIWLALTAFMVVRAITLTISYRPAILERVQ